MKSSASIKTLPLKGIDLFPESGSSGLLTAFIDSYLSLSGQFVIVSLIGFSTTILRSAILFKYSLTVCSNNATSVTPENLVTPIDLQNIFNASGG